MSNPFSLAYPSFIEMGYSPIPIKPGDKFPGEYKGMETGWLAMNGWQQFCDAPAEDWELNMWATKWPGTGIGVAHNSTFGCLDFDDDVGGCHELIMDLVAEIPGAIVRRKGRNGYAQYFQLDGNVRSRAYRVKDVGNYLEVMAQGRQTVCPPTIHPKTEKSYFWLTDDTLENTELDQLPLITSAHIERIEEIMRDHGWDPNQAEEANTWTGGRRGQGSNPYEIANNNAMLDLHLWVPQLNIERCEPKGQGYHAVPTWRPSNTGRPSHERKLNLSIQPEGIKDFGSGDVYTPINLVMAVLGTDDPKKAWAYLWKRVGEELPPWNPVHDLAELEDNSSDEEIEQRHVAVKIAMAIKKKATVDIPFSTTGGVYSSHKAGGLLGEISKFCLDNSIRPSEEFALFAAIGVCSALFGRKYMTPTYSGLNIYGVAMGGSGFGKDMVLKTIKACFAQDYLKRYIGGTEVSSDSAIYKILTHQPTTIMPVDEVGMFLAGVQSGKASTHERRVKKALLELYSSSSSSWAARTTGDADQNREPVIKPCFAMIGVSTETELFKGLTYDNITDGLMARCLFTSPMKRAPRNRKVTHKQVPHGIIDRMIASVESMPDPEGNMDLSHINIFNADPSSWIVPWADEDAEAAWERIDDWAIRIADENLKDMPDGIVNRVAENTVRLATLRALSRDDKEAQVTLADMQWGASIVRGSIETLVRMMEMHMSTGPLDRLRKDVLRFVSASDGAVTIGEILRSLPGAIENRDLNTVLSQLQSMGEIDSQDMEIGGRTQPAYFSGTLPLTVDDSTDNRINIDDGFITG
jgi:hypothetical protein